MTTEATTKELIDLLKECLAIIKSEYEGPRGTDLTGANIFRRVEKAIAKAERTK